jgi:hypothetical protein
MKRPEISSLLEILHGPGEASRRAETGPYTGTQQIPRMCLSMYVPFTYSEGETFPLPLGEKLSYYSVEKRTNTGLVETGNHFGSIILFIK